LPGADHRPIGWDLDTGHIARPGSVSGVTVFETQGKENTMPVQVTAIMLGVESLDRSKKFYGEGLGCTIDQDYPNFVRLDLGEGSSSLALYEREAAAADAGVSAEGSGFRGVSFHYIVPSGEAVNQAMKDAVAAGAEVVKEVAATDWGTFGYFSDPDGYLWKVASSGQ
jgi:catechol 2,3-dioxygenase-like lactoylglutathione lyase family enzyme